MTAKVYCSIIIPVFNEVDNLKLLNDKIKSVFDRMSTTYEVIYVDDCSNDGSDKVLKEIASSDEKAKVVIFKRNFGQTAAMAAGFDYAQGDVIITMDADLQNDPEDIPALLEKYQQEGCDIVSGWRKSRKDNIIRKIPSKIANNLISKLTGTHLNDYGCTLKAYNAKMAKELKLYGELHRFIPAIAAIDGATIVEMPVNHHPRIYGQSKYNLARTFKVFLDLLTVVFLRKFITRPLHVFGRMGLILFGGIFALAMFLVYNKISLHMHIDDADIVILMVLLTLFGIQLICMGIFSEILIRSYFEGQQKKIYTVNNTFNVEEEIEAN